MASKFWSDEEKAHLVRRIADGAGRETIAVELGRTFRSVDHMINRLNAAKPEEEAITPADARRAQTQRIRHEAANPPIEVDYRQRCMDLERELALLREQKAWETHSDSVACTDGTLTLFLSDQHLADENHLLSCAAALEAKATFVVGRYKPSRIQIINGGDWIAGRGIFREQDLQCAVSDPEHQLMVGAVKWRRLIKAIRSASDAPILSHWLKGNHEMAPGKTELGPSLFYRTRTLCEDIENHTMKMHNHRAVVNLAHEGTHNVLAYHGFGHSKTSPNSPAFIDCVKDDVIAFANKHQPHESIRRVLSGHTHWASTNLERLRGLIFDTCGGLQRNNRVQLGKNSRPLGWIVYVSQPGNPNEIQQPITLKPEDETHDRELSDPHLGAANRQDCAACLTEWTETMKERGLEVTSDAIGVTDGRW